MSICHSGLNCKLETTTIAIEVSTQHPLIKLANTIDWEALAHIVLPDLKRTAKGYWWRGRRLKLRSHLGAYLLQQLYNLTDRSTEQHINDNPVYQVFCGKTVVSCWRCPDHTKIESFRSRLAPETQCQLANAMPPWLHAMALLSLLMLISIRPSKNPTCSILLLRIYS